MSKPKLSFASHRSLRNRLTIGAIKAAFRRSQQRQIADLIAASCPRLLSFLLFSLFFFLTKKRDRIFFAIFGYATVVPWCWDQHRNLLAHCAVRFFFLFPPITIQKRPSLFLVIVRPYICILCVHKQRRKRKENNTIDRQLWSRDCSASRGRVGLPRLCVQIVQTLTFGGRPVERGGGM